MKLNTTILSIFALLLVSCNTVDPMPDDKRPEVGDEDGFGIEYVPRVEVMVENGAGIESKEDYVNAIITISEGDECTLLTQGRIKGRGNATWGYPKKPYKIKLDEKMSVCGFPANKDWVLLADYCDKSMMRTAYMCEVASAVGMPYPIRYRHVQLYVNDDYVGLYVLTDQVEKKKHRVDIEDDGFLFENDNYATSEPLYFTTDRRRYQFSFKHPDPEDGEIAQGDENFSFIVGFMNDFESALYSDDFKDPEVGYRRYIDVESFAKWFLVCELTANLEPNIYYVLPSRDSRLKIGPVWDAEWSLGLAYRGGEYEGWASLPTRPDPEQRIWSSWKYYGRLFEDPYFVGKVREEWADFLLSVPQLKKRLSGVSESITDVQKDNFIKWPILDDYVSVGLVCLNSWEAEVRYVEDFFDKRIEWLGSFLALNEYENEN